LINPVKIVLLVLFFVALSAASLLVYSVSEASKPIERSERVSTGRSVPAIPKVGLPGAVKPEEELLNVTPQTAKQINESRPFVTGRITLALPFRSALTGQDKERAVACLATAGFYEAGGRSGDQSAVMQVVLNRVRHPAFPDTVCAVVFQGSERRTGCQFSFTCDGSMRRRQPSPAAWRSAQGLALAMLDDTVDERVGLATHFHTDWVVPYWSDSLDKLTHVRTHLFFRWRGYWGTRAAFRRSPGSSEMIIPALATLFASHRLVGTEGEEQEELVEATVDGTDLSAQSLDGNGLPSATAPAATMPSIMHLALADGMTAGRWAIDAVSLCRGQRVCRVVGWSNPAEIPATFTRARLTASPPDLVFVQISRDRRQQAYWNCSRWPKASTSRCLGNAEAVVALLAD
jgi:hypothetical protein